MMLPLRQQSNVYEDNLVTAAKSGCEYIGGKV